jgi:cellulose synthase/poly-beta-1,6-N-acetylglucosamine synthase-like glycosyltransferase
MTQTTTGLQVESLKLAYLILACNEETVIAKTIRSVKSAMLPVDSLIVVADNCDDATAQVSKDSGADVLLREDRTSTGKSSAMIWLVKEHKDLLQSFDYLVILDADSIISRDFSLQLIKQLSVSDQAIQCHIVPIEFQESPISTLSALSEIIEQSVYQHLRSLLGFSIRLRGTGMVFKPEALIKFAPRLQINV